MKQAVHAAFDLNGVNLPLSAIHPIRQVKSTDHAWGKYRAILSSIREVGMIEPLIVHPQKKSRDVYFLLDGHMRLKALLELGRTEAFCLVATFLLWLEYFRDHNLSLICGEDNYRTIRTAVHPESKDRNQLRHTAITYHCLAFRNPLQTAYVAGNSVGIIQNHYLNMNIPEADALKLYELTPQRARELGIL